MRAVLIDEGYLKALSIIPVITGIDYKEKLLTFHKGFMSMRQISHITNL